MDARDERVREMDETFDEKMKRAKEIAEKLHQKANEALSGLERTMDIMGWPPEFRAIMWRAVGEEALRRANKG